MSYAIIRNAKYKRENLMAVYRHDERKNKHYSNKDIDRSIAKVEQDLQQLSANKVVCDDLNHKNIMWDSKERLY